MGSNGCYLYGFVNRTGPLSLGAIGLGNREIYLKSGGGYSVAMSDLDGVDFSRLPQKSLLTHVAEHQRALEGLMAEGEVVPLKFGTLATDLGEVEAILAKGDEQIRESFEKVRGKTELDVVATFSDFEGELRAIGTSEAVAALQHRAAPVSEVAGHNARVTLGKMVKRVLDEKRKDYADAVVKRLSGVSVACKVLDILDDATIVNVAALLEATAVPRFEMELEALDRGFEERVNFRMIGPMPCNSFHTLMIHRVHFEEIHSARRCLELGTNARLSDIRDAYRLMIRASHPDSNPQGTRDQAQFESINKSYRLLMGVCGNGTLSFLEEDRTAWVGLRPMARDPWVGP